MMVRLSSKDVSPIEMGSDAWTIRPALMGVPGVADVAVWGQRKRQLQVQVDPSSFGEMKVSHSLTSSRPPATHCGCHH